VRSGVHRDMANLSDNKRTAGRHLFLEQEKTRQKRLTSERDIHAARAKGMSRSQNLHRLLHAGVAKGGGGERFAYIPSNMSKRKGDSVALSLSPSARMEEKGDRKSDVPTYASEKVAK